MGSSFLAGDLRTGEILVKSLPVAGGGAVATLGSAGSITCDVFLPLIDPYTEEAIDIVNQISGPNSFLAYEETVEDDEGTVIGSRIINAGPIWSDVYEFDSGKYTLTAGGLLTIFDYRLVLQLLDDAVAGDLPGATSIDHENFKLATIARRLVRDAVAATGGELPIDIPADEAGTRVRHYIANEYNVVRPMLDNLQGVINGPDIMLLPYRSDASHIRWALATGRESDGMLTQAGDPHVFDTTAVVPPIRGVKVTRDWKTLRNAAYGVARPAEDGTVPEAKRINDAAFTTTPRLEVGAGYDVSELAVLEEKLDGEVANGRYPSEIWSFEAVKNVAPIVTAYAEGDLARIIVGMDNPRVAEGPHPVRILTIDSKHDSDVATITCAPARTPA